MLPYSSPRGFVAKVQTGSSRWPRALNWVMTFLSVLRRPRADVNVKSCPSSATP